MEAVNSIKEYINVPKEHREEFNKRNVSCNNKVFSWLSLAAAAIYGLSYAATFFLLDENAGIGEMERVRGFYLGIACIALTAFFILSWIRRFCPRYMGASDTVASAEYLLFFILLQCTASVAADSTGIININVMVLGLFIIVFFARFKLVNTLVLLTVVTAYLMAAFSSELRDTVNYYVSMFNLVIAYLMAAAASCLFWGAQVRNFLWEKNLESLLTSDFLTNVHNRRGFDYLLRRAWDEAINDHSRLAMLLIDIDHFKNYNDLYSHMEGDKCLTQVADLIASTVRAGDFVARYGGEEFVVIMKDTDAPIAKIVANRMLRSIRDKGIPHGASVCPYVTISIGGSTVVPAEGKVSVQCFLKTVDDAMYLAKENGRDRAEFLFCDNVKQAGLIR